jgi:hypothetical protein
MNERIRELIKQADIEFDVSSDNYSVDTATVTPYDLEKFAELIIAECCVALHPMLRDMISRTQGVELIVRHFRGQE